jgi:predicted alpha/beta hydrolase
MRALELPVETGDGHRAALLARLPATPRASLLWLPGMGLAARHYLPFAEAAASRGVAVFVHEWRGNGASSLRASRTVDWGYRELLADIEASEGAVAAALPGLDRLLGGHSLGGQLACCRLALRPDAARALWLVGSGSPWWRAFPAPTRWWLPAAYRFLDWLARRNGSLPGKRIGFGGNEARGVIADWSRSALTGRYAARGLGHDLERGMAGFRGQARGVVLAEDWLAPPSSLAFLLGKLRGAEAATHVLHADALGTRADHYAWMKQPDAVVERLLG